MKMALTTRVMITAVALSVFSAVSAQAQGVRSFYELSLKPEAISITQDSGGNIALYIVKAEEYRADQSMVAFRGQCDSACTLLLSLTPVQICVMPGASFRFHAPICKTEEAEKSAADIMMKKYPYWVQDWIAARGGLTAQLATMNYTYASQYVQSCVATIY